MAARRISIYLNDHLAGSVVAAELARRSAMDLEGVRVDRAKLAAAWVAEKAGRLKLNGSVFSYSPLSRLEELEFLSLAVEGKLLL